MNTYIAYNLFAILLFQSVSTLSPSSLPTSVPHVKPISPERDLQEKAVFNKETQVITKKIEPEVVAYPTPEIVTNDQIKSISQKPLSSSNLAFDFDLFLGFRAENVGGEFRDAFTLDRSELGAKYDFLEKFGFVFRLQSIRSASPESFLGIDGDSIVIRVREAFGHTNLPLGNVGTISGNFGLIRDPWIETLESSYNLRPISPLLAQRGGFFETSDLGASLSWTSKNGFLRVNYALTNGEGLRQTEQNNGKNSTIILSVTPLHRLQTNSETKLAFHLGYRDGSLGVGRAPDHRITGAISLLSPLYRFGTEYIHAIGFQNIGNRTASGLGAWASASPWKSWLGFFTRYDLFIEDISLQNSQQSLLTLGAYADILPARSRQRNNQLRFHIAMQQERFGDNAGPIPGASETLDTRRILFLLSAKGIHELQ